MNDPFDTGAGRWQLPQATLDGIRTRYAAAASQMQCPLHQKDARVELDGDRLDDLEVEVFTCCSEFAHRVHAALQNCR